jgi:ubiquitin C-terminal hydrolase
MRGLLNLGNTCYFNTAVQCLAHVPPLTKHFFEADLSSSKCAVTKEYQKVVKQLFIKGKTDPVDPRELLVAFRTRFPQFAGYGQHDTQEVILHLVDLFEQSLGKEFITDLFNGEETQVTEWGGGETPKNFSLVKTTFTTMLLSVTEPCRLQDLLKDRTDPISIENYKDDSGRVHEKATVQTRVSRWPKFTNFSFSMYDYKFPIEIPLEFEGLKLFACVMHQGHRNCGHYALLVRRFDKWYIKDDERINEIPEVTGLRGEFYQAWYRPVHSLTLQA